MNNPTTTLNAFPRLKVNGTSDKLDIQTAFYFNRASRQKWCCMACATVKSFGKSKSHTGIFEVSYARLHTLFRFSLSNNFFNFCQTIQIIIDAVDVGALVAANIVVDNGGEFSDGVLPFYSTVSGRAHDCAQKFKMLIEVVLAYSVVEHHFSRFCYQRMVRVGNICFIAVRQNTDRISICDDRGIRSSCPRRPSFFEILSAHFLKGFSRRNIVAHLKTTRLASCFLTFSLRGKNSLLRLRGKCFIFNNSEISYCTDDDNCEENYKYISLFHKIKKFFAKPPIRFSCP